MRLQSILVTIFCMQVEILESSRTSTAACDDVSLLGALKHQRAPLRQILGTDSKPSTLLLQLCCESKIFLYSSSQLQIVSDWEWGCDLWRANGKEQKVAQKSDLAVKHAFQI